MTAAGVARNKDFAPLHNQALAGDALIRRVPVFRSSPVQLLGGLKFRTIFFCLPPFPAKRRSRGEKPTRGHCHEKIACIVDFLPRLTLCPGGFPLPNDLWPAGPLLWAVFPAMLGINNVGRPRARVHAGLCHRRSTAPHRRGSSDGLLQAGVRAGRSRAARPYFERGGAGAAGAKYGECAIPCPSESAAAPSPVPFHMVQ